MAKKTNSTAAAGPSKAQPVGSSKAASSIDDIFAKPSKGAAVPGPSNISKRKGDKGKSKAAQGSTTALPSGAKVDAPLKTKKKGKQLASFDPDNMEPPARSSVVEVLDPSLAAISAKVAAAKSSAGDLAKRKREKKEHEDDEVFRDSRGTGPRRKTEEGYSIYKEAELGINPEAGGTPLCPFDCDCCF